MIRVTGTAAPFRIPAGVLTAFAACILLGPAAASPAQVAPGTQNANGERVLRATFTARPPTLDGRLDEPEWATAEVATEFSQSEPREGPPLTERTVVRVLFDRENLYVSAYCYDSDPSRIIDQRAEA